MKLLLQRVSRAEVEVEGRSVGAIGKGLLILLGLEKGDDSALAEEAARKVAGLRIFEDDAGKMNRTIVEAGGSVLVVSQFTLAADLSKGRRPGFSYAMPPGEAEPLYEFFAGVVAMLGLPVQKGVFGANMAVSLVNDGPTTFWLELPARKSGEPPTDPPSGGEPIREEARSEPG